MNDYEKVFEAVRSSLSGNGKLRVNNLVRRYGMVMSDFTGAEWYRVCGDVTELLLTGDENDKIPYYDEFDPARGKLSTWVNWKVLSYIKKMAKARKEKQKEPFTMNLEEAGEYLISDVPDPENLLIIRETCEALEKLKPYIPAYNGEKSYKELAEELGVSEKTIQRRVMKLSNEIRDLKINLK